MIAEALAGRRVAVTGATGFLGTALVERLLRSVPSCDVAVLVRPGRRAGAAERTRREILRNDCFDRLRSELGAGFDDMINSRLSVIAGDVSSDGLGLDDAGRELLASCDVVVHSAATVAFDAPLDAAAEVNLLGPSRVAQAIAAAAAGARRPPAHLLAVSTAYVAGTRRGDARETLLSDTPFATNADWRAEVAAARKARADIDTESRRPERLAGFMRRARRELGAAGVPLLADKAERVRQEWLREQMVELGRARARSLGWPDAYAYSKALGERALLDNRGDVPVTIVRPSIIESALAEPRPGWIRGFRMAEPVIIAYGKGLLSQFPGLPEGVLDVIPVDLVVAAIIAAAAEGPDTNGPSVIQVASGARNPLRWRAFQGLVEAWFGRNPLYDALGQPIAMKPWSYPDRGKVRRQLGRAIKGLEMAERALGALPVRGREAQFSARLEERRLQAERALSYVELYGSYSETEARFDVARLMAMWERTAPADREEFNFDPGSIDWPSYVQEIHLPSVVAHARVRTTGGGQRGASRHDRGLSAVLSSERHLAVFDLENTLIASNVVESYAWLATRHLGTAGRIELCARLLGEAPRLLSLDRRDRGDFLRAFYRRYDGADASQIDQDALAMFSSLLLAKAFPAGIDRVRRHRALGHRTLLITGALEQVVRPLSPLFDDIVAAHMSEREGRLTGELVESPPTGEARAMLIADYAAAHGLSLDQSVAYADSSSDLPMLEAVGFPVAVNPEVKLATIARQRGWHVERWERATGGARLVPALAPLAGGGR